MKLTLDVYHEVRQGGRQYMEDIISIVTNCDHTKDPSSRSEEPFACFYVFDGHGGVDAAKFAEKHLHQIITSQDGFYSSDVDVVLKAIRKGFLATHKLMWNVLDTWPRTHMGNHSTSGTTASMVLIRGTKMYVAHVGDSGVVVGEESAEDQALWEAHSVTIDHKPDCPKEKKRIESIGGAVVLKSGVPRVVWKRERVVPGLYANQPTTKDSIPFLAVARSLGDLWSYCKQNDGYYVSPEPDVSVHLIQPHKTRCIILASDGLWNAISASDAVKLVKKCSENSDQLLQGVCKDPASLLVGLALKKCGLRCIKADNTSAIVVLLNTPSTQSPDPNTATAAHPITAPVALPDDSSMHSPMPSSASVLTTSPPIIPSPVSALSTFSSCPFLLPLNKAPQRASIRESRLNNSNELNGGDEDDEDDYDDDDEEEEEYFDDVNDEEDDDDDDEDDNDENTDRSEKEDARQLSDKGETCTEVDTACHAVAASLQRQACTDAKDRRDVGASTLQDGNVSDNIANPNTNLAEGSDEGHGGRRDAEENEASAADGGKQGSVELSCMRDGEGCTREDVAENDGKSDDEGVKECDSETSSKDNKDESNKKCLSESDAKEKETLGEATEGNCDLCVRFLSRPRTKTDTLSSLSVLRDKFLCDKAFSKIKSNPLPCALPQISHFMTKPSAKKTEPSSDRSDFHASSRRKKATMVRKLGALSAWRVRDENDDSNSSHCSKHALNGGGSVSFSIGDNDHKESSKESQKEDFNLLELCKAAYDDLQSYNDKPMPQQPVCFLEGQMNAAQSSSLHRLTSDQKVSETPLSDGTVRHNGLPQSLSIQSDLKGQESKGLVCAYTMLKSKSFVDLLQTSPDFTHKVTPMKKGLGMETASTPPSILKTPANADGGGLDNALDEDEEQESPYTEGLVERVRDCDGGGDHFDSDKSSTPLHFKNFKHSNKNKRKTNSSSLDSSPLQKKLKMLNDFNCELTKHKLIYKKMEDSHSKDTISVNENVASNNLNSAISSVHKPHTNHCTSVPGSEDNSGISLHSLSKANDGAFESHNNDNGLTTASAVGVDATSDEPSPTSPPDKLVLEGKENSVLLRVEACA